MQTETCKTFALMCEEVINEVSSTMDMVKSKIGGREVVKHLHTKMGLGHEQKYSPVDKISWSQLKDSYQGSWVIIHGDKGAGAINYDGRTYTAVASDGGEVRSFTNDRGGNIIDFLKGIIGQLRKFFVGKDNWKAKELKAGRKERQKTAGPAKVDQDTLVKKFKPLWQKAIQAAVADIKGHVANMIKNDAFEKAKKKLNQIEALNNALEAMETGSLEDAPGFVKGAVNQAVLMAASYYYPEQTGDISHSRYGGGMSAARQEGPQQLLNDITNGDTAKVGTILAFFKRALISG
jgi:hypothetical protein